MLALLVSPTIGRAVSRGVFGTNDLEAPNGAGLLSAKKGARPVAVGPDLQLATASCGSYVESIFTSKELGCSLEVLGHIFCTAGRRRPWFKHSRSYHSDQSQQSDNHQTCHGQGYCSAFGSIPWQFILVGELLWAQLLSLGRIGLAGRYVMKLELCVGRVELLVDVAHVGHDGNALSFSASSSSTWQS